MLRHNRLLRYCFRKYSTFQPPNNLENLGFRKFKPSDNLKNLRFRKYSTFQPSGKRNELPDDLLNEIILMKQNSKEIECAEQNLRKEIDIIGRNLSKESMKQDLRKEIEQSLRKTLKKEFEDSKNELIFQNNTATMEKLRSFSSLNNDIKSQAINVYKTSMLVLLIIISAFNISFLMSYAYDYCKKRWENFNKKLGLLKV
ncbi:hypothetical protein GLOIN_2v1781383 [Rhizophagus clarus]|uniref:Uncharacterized protein n=1 Tax=Rhizophagus clarus TaxID=94130 RepID=A0A8H3LAV3_9GLOM|nr:hypothetical protein GLOIN_2v1781383 [Rhizophagus clarus]